MEDVQSIKSKSSSSTNKTADKKKKDALTNQKLKLLKQHYKEEVEIKENLQKELDRHREKNVELEKEI